jgi:glutamate-1-semialdehyde 2,1-aminomutase
LRSLCTQHGALLILDEVISGFRLGPGGAAAHYDIDPDLATFGKVIGGGMPVGAFAGSAELMKNLAPDGDVYQAGTLSGNPVAMAAGLATLTTLEAEDGWTRINETGRKLEQVLAPILGQAPMAVSLATIGSMFWLGLYAADPPRRAEEIDARAAAAYTKIFHSLLDQGVAIAPSAYEVGFVSLAHTASDIDRFAVALQSALSEPAVRALAE